ncbi:hypothetical protein PCURB6_24990 [Paenibacillus curdlanolyticus]|nr:beta-ketoacyl-[acyl-carrier-protein] synthase family protein [Paenibacillus curdlanolyticus]GFN32239.1 hypothetical protein PCURB6_24990 [Paenibacillus curdlanolyticus]
MLSDQQVVVTGMGIVSAIGGDVDSFWEAIASGKSGITNVEHILALDHCKSKLGAPILSFDDTGLLLEQGYDDRGIRLTLAALEQATAQSRYRESLIDSDRVGVVIGTCAGGVGSGQRWLQQQHGGGHDPEPRLLRMYDYNTAAEVVSHVLNARGPVMTVSTACASSNNAIGVGWDWIREGKADIVFVGGYDSLLETVYSGFHSVDALDSSPCRPYSADRGGLSLGEGAAFLVLESRKSARRRNAAIKAAVLGYGLAADGYHPTAPHPEGAGAARAIRTALRNAGLEPGHIDYINGHGTGTLQNDQSETNAIMSVFGSDASRVPVSSTKAATGHTLGASGVIEGIATICAMEHRFIPPTVGLSNPDARLPLNFVGCEGRSADIRYALSHSFAFGGNNAVVVFAHPDAELPSQAVRQQSVVVTGIGIVTHAGVGKTNFWHTLTSKEEQTNHTKQLHLSISEDIETDISQSFDRKDIRRMDRNTLFMLYGVLDALRDALLPIETDCARPQTIGIMTGHAHSVFEHFTELYRPMLEPDVRVRPSVFPNSVYNGAAGYIASHFQLLGPASTINGGGCQHGAGDLSCIRQAAQR